MSLSSSPPHPLLLLYPSIHIKNGVVARLTRSSSDSRQAELLHPDPASRAAAFAADGFSWLHVVDLDGAFSEEAATPMDGHTKRQASAAAVEAMIRTVAMPVQLSGGIRDMQAIEFWLQRGVTRIVLASAALQSPDLVREAARAFPERIAVKIDSIGGQVARKGWTKVSALRALDLALRVEDAGVCAIIYADINLDGALSEVNLEAIIDLAFALTVPVIASGGIHSLQDIAEMKAQAHAGIDGLILGRALYNGAIDARAALRLAAEA